MKQVHLQVEFFAFFTFFIKANSFMRDYTCVIYAGTLEVSFTSLLKQLSKKREWFSPNFWTIIKQTLSFLRKLQ